MTHRVLIFLLMAAAALAQAPDPGQIAPIIVYSFPPQLKEYLAITNEQANQIVALNSAYTVYAAGKAQRVAQVRGEIAAETAKDPLDPAALGVRYAELEAIRRDLADRQTGVRQKAVALLTDPQRARLKNLDDASKLQPVVTQAQSANLIDTPPVTGLPVPTSIIRDPFPGTPIPFFPPELKTYLELTEQQAQTVASLNSVYSQDTYESTLRSAQLQREIQNETAKPVIDPMALGSLYAELEYMQRDLRRERAEVRKSTLVVLTDAQRSKLTALDDAAKLQPRVNDAVCENLLAPAPAPDHWFDTTTFTSLSQTLVGVISAVPVSPGCIPPLVFTPGP